MDEKKKPAEGKKQTNKKPDQPMIIPEHLGSSNAFSETENPFSKDADNVSDERLDELLGE